MQKPDEFREKLKLASQELKDMAEVVRDSVKNQGVDKRNFIEILNSKRRGTTMSNLVARDLEHLEATKSTKTTEQYQEELKMIVENFGKDIGIEMNLIYTDEAHMPKDSKGKGGAARRESDGKLVAYVDVTKNETTSELLETVFEEVAHLIDLQAGRKHETTEEEKQRGEHGLETLGRPIGNYFKDKYEETSTDFTNTQIDTEDYTDVDGETVGNTGGYCITYNENCKNYNKNFLNKRSNYSIINPNKYGEREEVLIKKGYGSLYVGIYLASENERKALFITEQGIELPVLYVDKILPKEYNRLMNLKDIKEGFNKNLNKISNKIISELVNRNLKLNQTVNLKDNFFENEILEHVNLTYPVIKIYPFKIEIKAFSWGNTNIRTKVNDIKIKRVKEGYEVVIKYGNRLVDEFIDALDIFNKIEGNQDLPGATPYIMKTSYTKEEKKLFISNFQVYNYRTRVIR